MPLSKSRDRERKRKIRLESNLKSEPMVEPTIPLYNPAKHHVGDVVRIDGKIVTIPELDADGNEIRW